MIIGECVHLKWNCLYMHSHSYAYLRSSTHMHTHTHTHKHLYTKTIVYRMNDFHLLVSFRSHMTHNFAITKHLIKYYYLRFYKLNNICRNFKGRMMCDQCLRQPFNLYLVWVFSLFLSKKENHQIFSSNSL